MIRIDQKISCIVPVYNEEENIAKVLEPLLEIKWIDEVIVVDDGSSDRTKTVISGFKDKRLQLIPLEINQGKGAALYRGIKKAKNDLLVFLDGDLVGLKEEHLLELISPLVFSKSADLSLGVFAIIKLNKNASTKIANRAVPWITGQRAIYKKNLPDLEQIRRSRYGVDLLISKKFKKDQIRIVKLRGLSQTVKEDKQDLFSAMRARVKMYYQISKILRSN